MIHKFGIYLEMLYLCIYAKRYLWHASCIYNNNGDDTLLKYNILNKTKL